MVKMLMEARGWGWGGARLDPSGEPGSGCEGEAHVFPVQ